MRRCAPGAGFTWRVLRERNPVERHVPRFFPEAKLPAIGRESYWEEIRFLQNGIGGTVTRWKEVKR